ncbi:uncharacterized protein LOC9630146 isoform X1 [Selaginella moellendorffii]|uniref:uncharacterized protein LOC9630146 isoform X1 n=2 Tax=Selaginella moellendorffii TaxID=88036 RepID=UPI000D1C23FD|nr:uncharacterized protein LOC9630146 isoform X1 [Selaginella moellendorffii]|eukprot:XP_024522045.1 uncharacterized protein LOC9630146 isoform X1 [Selaginella moellendorffii]
MLARKKAEAKRVKARLRDVDFARLQAPGRSQTLPFPGLSTSAVGKRPPREFEFVGRSAYSDIMRLVIEEDPQSPTRGLLITGARGKGKSCMLRAVAVELVGRSQRAICFWYLDACQDVLRQVQDSLLFAYSDSEEALAEIERVSSVESLSGFLEGRKAAGDFIFFVSDDEENYDDQHKDGTSRRRAEAKKWLEALQRGCDVVIKTLSPEAHDVRVGASQMEEYELKDNFGEEEYSSFIRGTTTVLGGMLKNHPDREEDVLLFAGKHPMSLFYLSSACDEYVRDITGISCSRKRPRLKSFGMIDVQTGETRVYEDPGKMELEGFLDDEQAWQAVLLKFKQGEPFKSIRKYIKDYRGPEESLRDPASVSKSFVSGDGSFCTDFIYAVHLEAALERLKGLVFRSPTFQAIVQGKLDDPDIIWSHIGWACEGFVAEAIMAVGLKFKQRVRRPVELKSLNGEPVRLDPSQWEPFKPVYLKPGRYSFKYIDGVIAWVDEKGVLHFLALQVTVSPEGHTKTEYQFMQRAQVERWYTGPCIWYYVYLCPVKVESLEESRKASSSRGGSSPTSSRPVQSQETLVEYQREQLQFDQCFDQNLGQEEVLLLRKLGEVREREMERRKKAKAMQEHSYRQLLKSLPPRKWALYKRLKTRELLEVEAKKCGISDPSPKNYKNIYVLLSAMDV